MRALLQRLSGALKFVPIYSPANLSGLPTSQDARFTALSCPPVEADDRLRIGFLFNHEHVHQVAHSAPIAFELSKRAPQLRVCLISASPDQTRMLDQMSADFPGQRCEMFTLELPPLLRVLEKIFGSWLPVRKLAMLKANVCFFKAFYALVVPEKTSLSLKTRFDCKSLKLIHTRHGAGDRAIGFDRNSGGFDMVLLAGEKIRERLTLAGQLPEHWKIVGYPKFDTVGATRRAGMRKSLFKHDRPTVLYNPHCSPHLSSWYRWGAKVLEFFYQSNDYNLIFAPHVMLYRKRLQVTIDKVSVAWAAKPLRRYQQCEHMLLDLGTSACTDMTYTFAADLYLGDVSSQVCEFLLDSRPCMFLNSHGLDWQHDPSYESWRLGPVIDKIDRLESGLRQAISSHHDYRDAQARYFARTFDLSEMPSSQRAADAVAEFIDMQQQLKPRPEVVVNRLLDADRIAAVVR